jgi:YgiT-type zinc finger domain-containing protein
MKPYDDCIYCGGGVEEQRLAIDYRHHGQLFIMENVPVGVCRQCGERFLTADVVKELEQLATRQDAPVATVAVPVLRAS